jgi:phosphoribosylformylglycinamidine cyclo-ligase
MGVGMVALVAPADVDRALALLLARHVPAWVAGEITAGTGDVTMTGSHPA